MMRNPDRHHPAPASRPPIRHLAAIIGISGLLLSAFVIVGVVVTGALRAPVMPEGQELPATLSMPVPTTAGGSPSGDIRSASTVLGEILDSFPSLNSKLSRTSSYIAITKHDVRGWRNHLRPTPPDHLRPEERQAWLARAWQSDDTNALSVFYPERFDHAQEISASGMQIRVVPSNALPATGRPVDGRMVYPDVYPHTDVVFTNTMERSEEFLRLRHAEAPTEFSYVISSGSPDTTLSRMTLSPDGSVLLADTLGRSLHIDRPYLVEADGKLPEAAVRWNVDPTENTGEWRLTLAVTGKLNYPVLIDPSWSTAASMIRGRAGHTATLLPSGKVLVTGGHLVYETLNSYEQGTTANRVCELYDPSNNTWSDTGSLTAPRSLHTATLLYNGKVLVTGGLYFQTSPYGMAYQRTHEIYDPDTGQWTSGGSAMMSSSRAAHTATLLTSGKVLVVGGYGGDGTADLYNPTTNQWATTSGSIGNGRFHHTATLLPSGKVLIAGGGDGVGYHASASIAIYDPLTGVNGTSAVIANTLKGARYLHRAQLFPNGKVMIAGGSNVYYAYEDNEWGCGCLAYAQGSTLKTVEWFDPSNNTTALTDSMPDIADWHSASFLPDSGWLLTGGLQLPAFSHNQAAFDYYESRSPAWVSTTYAGNGRSQHRSTVLASGIVLLTGGQNAFGGNALMTCTRLLPNTPVSPLSLNTVTPSADSIVCVGSGFLPKTTSVVNAVWQSVDGERVHRLTNLATPTDTVVHAAMPPDAGPGWLRIWVDGMLTTGMYVNVPLPSLTLTSSSSSVTDNDGTAVLTATLSRPFHIPILATLNVSDTAVYGEDYTLSGQSFNLPVQSTTNSITLTGKSENDGIEFLRLSLTNVTLGLSTGSGVNLTILPANRAPMFYDPEIGGMPIAGNPLDDLHGGLPNGIDTPVGKLIEALVFDPDLGSAQGIAVIEISGSGAWESSTNFGKTWTSITSVSESSALLLPDAGSIRYKPLRELDEIATITFRAWDRTSGLSGQRANTATNGGSSAFSSTRATSLVKVDGAVPPSLTLSGGIVNWKEGDPPQQLDGEAICTDPDSTYLPNGKIIIAISPGRPGDLFTYSQLLTGGTVILSGALLRHYDDATEIYGSLAGGVDGASLVITLTGQATPELAQTILQGITFTNIGGNPVADPTTSEDRTITVTVSDGKAISEPKQRVLRIEPIDSLPVITPLTMAGVPGATVVSRIVAHDPEGNPLSYSLLSQPTKGEVEIDPTSGTLRYRNTSLVGLNDSFDVGVTASGRTAPSTVLVRISAPGSTPGRFTSVPPALGRINLPVSYTPTVVGLGSTMEFQLDPPPQVAATRTVLGSYSFSPSTGALSFTPSGLVSGDYIRIGIVAIDPATNESVYQPILIKIILATDG